MNEDTIVPSKKYLDAKLAEIYSILNGYNNYSIASKIIELINNIFNIAISLFVIIAWIAGIVLAKGFWSTLCAIFPFYAWYLVIEKAMIINGLL